MRYMMVWSNPNTESMLTNGSQRSLNRELNCSTIKPIWTIWTRHILNTHNRCNKNKMNKSLMAPNLSRSNLRSQSSNKSYSCLASNLARVPSSFHWFQACYQVGEALIHKRDQGRDKSSDLIKVTRLVTLVFTGMKSTFLMASHTRWREKPWR